MNTYVRTNESYCMIMICQWCNTYKFMNTRVRTDKSYCMIMMCQWCNMCNFRNTHVWTDKLYCMIMIGQWCNRCKKKLWTFHRYCWWGRVGQGRPACGPSSLPTTLHVTLVDLVQQVSGSEWVDGMKNSFNSKFSGCFRFFFWWVTNFVFLKTMWSICQFIVTVSAPPKGGQGCLMSPSCLESQGCHLVSLSYLLSCFFLPSPFALSVLSFFC